MKHCGVFPAAMSHDYTLQKLAFKCPLNKNIILTLITAALVSLVSCTNGLTIAGRSKDCCLGRANTRCGGIAVQEAKDTGTSVLVQDPLRYHLTSSTVTVLSHFPYIRRSLGWTRSHNDSLTHSLTHQQRRNRSGVQAPPPTSCLQQVPPEFSFVLRPLLSLFKIEIKK